MSRKNPYIQATKTAQPAAIAEDATAHTAARKHWNRLLRDAPAPVNHSIEAATRFPVETENYTPRERAAANMAMDASGESLNALSFTTNTGFPGFPTLSLLAQLPEYRTMHETLADECVRCWGEVTSAGRADSGKLQAIEAELERINAKAIFRQAVLHDQAFGGGHIGIKLKGDEKARELPLLMQPYSVPVGAFQGLRVIEPYWVTPNYYNSIDPFAADFYKPSTWWALGVEVHATRLQTIVSRPVADMLKPAYSFRGVSMSQLAMPYIDNWLRTRQSVSDTVKQFSISGVKTDLQQSLAPGAGQDLLNRAQLINAYRDNRNILFLDMATEEFFQVNTPLSGLDALQAQAQEQMSAVSHIPLVKLLGVTPTGLNASSEGEIRVFYDYVKGYQANVLTPPMHNVLQIAQLSLFGEVDPDISWAWHPLHEMTDLEAADARAKDADTDSKYMEAGVITPEQVAAVLHAAADSRYAGVLESGVPVETTPDDNIPAVTAHILGIGAGTAAGGGPLLESSPIDEGLEALADLTANTSQTPEPDSTGGPGAGQADPTITDPSAQADPGEMDDESDIQTAQ